MAKLMQIVSKVQQRLNTDLKIAGVLITQYDGRKNPNKSVSELVQETFQGKVFNTHIRNAIALAEAPTQGQDSTMHLNQPEWKITRRSATSY